MKRRYGGCPLPARTLVLVGLLATALTSCTTSFASVPRCASPVRLAILAQAVPAAAYVPCVDHVPTGWSDGGFEVEDGGASFDLVSDRVTSRKVHVDFSGAVGCQPASAVPVRSRAEGVRTAVALDSISPRYAGTLYDAFAGGCVKYRFDFPRGVHIALMDEFQEMVSLVARRQLRLDVEDRLGIDIGH